MHHRHNGKKLFKRQVAPDNPIGIDIARKNRNRGRTDTFDGSVPNRRKKSLPGKNQGKILRTDGKNCIQNRKQNSQCKKKPQRNTGKEDFLLPAKFSCLVQFNYPKKNRGRRRYRKNSTGSPLPQVFRIFILKSSTRPQEPLFSGQQPSLYHNRLNQHLQFW